MNRAPRIATMAVVMLAGLAGQAPRAFEVASIRPHPGDSGRVTSETSGMRFVAEEPIWLLVLEAYHVEDYQFPIPDPLSWVKQELFDIQAKAGGDIPPKPEEFREMLRTLLADRFNLKLRREMREIPVFAMVVAKNGPKLEVSASDAKPYRLHEPNGRNTVLRYTVVTVSEIADGVHNGYSLDRPVLDKTGLTGTYTIKLEATGQEKLTRVHDGVGEAGDLSIFSAIQNQLGLKLEAQKGMVEVLVLDHVERPTAN
jgi:uncharacterized protein (TIGR03435 family)